MPLFSFCIVWIIFIVNFVWEFFVKSELPTTVAPLLPGLLVVFILGSVLAAFEFIAAFMKKTPPTDLYWGVEVCSTALRPQAIELRLGAMSSWYAVLPLQGFFFFGTATLFYQKLKAILANDLDKPRAERLRLLMLDCTHLTGVDPTARNTLIKAHRLIVQDCGLELLWAGLGRNSEQFEKCTQYDLRHMQHNPVTKTCGYKL